MAKIKRLGSVMERECSGCKSLIEYSVEDVSIDDIGHRGDFLDCPICGKASVLGSIPDDWHQHIANRCAELGGF